MSVEVEFRHSFGAFALDVAFKIERACVTTSVVNAIAGLLRPQEGRIVINGRVVLDTKANIYVPARERRTGYVFQDAKLFPHMSVDDNLRFGWRRAPEPAGESEIAHVVELLGLSHLLIRFPKALSGGERPRRAWPRALVFARHPSAGRTAGGAGYGPAQRNPAVSRTPARRDEAADVLCQPQC